MIGYSVEWSLYAFDLKPIRRLEISDLGIRISDFLYRVCVVILGIGPIKGGT